MMTTDINNIKQALTDLRQGKFIILVDAEDRENEGDLILAAEHATSEKINFMSRYGRGLICMPMSDDDFSRLQIPLMVKQNRSKQQTAFGVSIGAARGITTGISAADRAHTIKTAVDPTSGPNDIVMPGHMFPLRARRGGVLERQGHTEGSADLMRLAGLRPAAVLCEVMNEDGTMARMPQLKEFANQHQITIVTIQDLVTYRMQQEHIIEEVSAANLPVRNYGNFLIKTFRNTINNKEHLALMHGEINPKQPTLVRMHSECLTGDVFNSQRCDCGNQLEISLMKIAELGGVLLYLRQEGRGIGLGNKIKAYALQEQGMDTVEANQHLGFAPDERDYGIGAQILRELGINDIKLLTNNPNKLSGLERYGIKVSERIPLETAPTKDNIHYLRAKREKLGHWLEMGVGIEEGEINDKL
jgi:3,4-dihydroxy 2-butanone 4-phosphate synthase / GTP cyclohydrolase II